MYNINQKKLWLLQSERNLYIITLLYVVVVEVIVDLT